MIFPRGSNLILNILIKTRPSTIGARCSSTGGKSAGSTARFTELDDAQKRIKRDLSEVPDKEKFMEYHQTKNGRVHDKKPFKFECKAGKAYLWCACGHSKSQVFINEHILRVSLFCPPLPNIESKGWWASIVFDSQFHIIPPKTIPSSWKSQLKFYFLTNHPSDLLLC